MDNLERLNCLKFELIKLALHKSHDINQWKKMRQNIILTNELIAEQRAKKDIDENEIENIENYIKSRKA